MYVDLKLIIHEFTEFMYEFMYVDNSWASWLMHVNYSCQSWLYINDDDYSWAD